MIKLARPLRRPVCFSMVQSESTAAPKARRSGVYDSIVKQPKLRHPYCLKGAGSAFNPFPSRKNEGSGAPKGAPTAASRQACAVCACLTASAAHPLRRRQVYAVCANVCEGCSPSGAPPAAFSFRRRAALSSGIFPDRQPAPGRRLVVASQALKSMTRKGVAAQRKKKSRKKPKKI